MEAQSVVIGVKEPCWNLVLLRSVVALVVLRFHRDGIEDVKAKKFCPVNVRSAFAFISIQLYVGQAAHAEDLAATHRLEQVAHSEIGSCLNVGCRDAYYIGALLHEHP